MVEIDLTENIREIKEDFNLIMFNSPKFSTNQMKIFNDIMEVMANAEIKLIIN